MRQNPQIASRPLRNHPLDSFTDTVFVQQTVVEATAKQFLGSTPSLFGNLHAIARVARKLDQAANCRFVSSASLCWSSTLKILPVTFSLVSTTKRPISRFKSASIL